MGASAWYCFIPYEENLVVAIRNAQARMWTEGDYIIDYDEEGKPILATALPKAERPQTIEELIERTGYHEHGLFTVSEEAVAHWTPVSLQVCIALFGTTRPNHSQVDEKWDWNDADGSYVIVYDQDRPEELYIWGCDEW